MNFQALDDPALLMPQVMNVDATLKRLGFVPRVRKGQHFYKLDVLLFYPVESKLSRRAISHVNMVVNVHESIATEFYRLHLWVTYGYPIRRHRGRRVVDDFKSMGDSEQFEYVIHGDNDLRATEKTVKEAIHNIRTRKLNPIVIDSDGREKHVPGWQALEAAVRSDLHRKNNIWKSPVHLRVDDSWWAFDFIPVRTEREPVPVREHSRLPNFDRVERPRHRGCARRT